MSKLNKKLAAVVAAVSFVTGSASAIGVDVAQREPIAAHRAVQSRSALSVSSNPVLAKVDGAARTVPASTIQQPQSSVPSINTILPPPPPLPTTVVAGMQQVTQAAKQAEQAAREFGKNLPKPPGQDR